MKATLAVGAEIEWECESIVESLHHALRRDEEVFLDIEEHHSEGTYWQVWLRYGDAESTEEYVLEDLGTFHMPGLAKAAVEALQGFLKTRYPGLKISITCDCDLTGLAFTVLGFSVQDL